MTTAEPTWLPLLRRLTTAEPAWTVWKNADRALRGEGDVDSVAPKQAWPTLIDEFRRWARESHVGPVIVCGHTPGMLIVVACAGSAPTRLLQLDGYERAAGLLGAEALQPVTEVDRRGFRRLRAGAEGLLLLLVLARRGGRPPRSQADLEHVERLISSDLCGAELTSRLLGWPGRFAFAGAVAVAARSWNRRAMLGVELVYAAGAVADPRQRAAWLRFKLANNQCPVLRALAGGRVVPGDRAPWLEEVAVSHTVYDTQPA